MTYATALVPGERRTLTPDEVAEAREWVWRLQAWAGQSGPIPAGVALAWPSVVTEVEVEHAAADRATLCGIDASRYEVYRSTFRSSSPLACPTCGEGVAGALRSERPTRPLTAMSEREALALVGKRVGMYVGRASFDKMVDFLHGYDLHGTRTGGGLFEGFRDWLGTHPGVGVGATGWPGAILRMAFPGDEVRSTQLTEAQDRHALTVLFDQLDAFLADRELNESRDPSIGAGAAD